MGLNRFEPQQGKHLQRRLGKLIEVTNACGGIKDTTLLDPHIQQRHDTMIDPLTGKINHVKPVQHIKIDNVILGHQFDTKLGMPQRQVKHLLILAADVLNGFSGKVALLEKFISVEVHRRTVLVYRGGFAGDDSDTGRTRLGV